MINFEKKPLSPADAVQPAKTSVTKAVETEAQSPKSTDAKGARSRKRKAEDDGSLL